MTKLTAHQKEAIDTYQSLLDKHPSLFTARHKRLIVRDPESIAAYAAEHGDVLGVAAETPYALFLVDLVENRKPNGMRHRYPYLRVVSRTQLEGGTNVVILATIENTSLGKKGDIVLIKQERHALGTIEAELPRGFGIPGLTGETTALRELEEETGYIGDRAYLLATTCIDSGLTDGLASFYHVPVVQRSPNRPEVGEAITEVFLASLDDAWRSIRSGQMRDGLSLQALALYEKFRA